MAKVNCRNFNGYKPCAYNDNCNDECAEFKAIGKKILVVHLGALGAVLRSTSLLRAIHRKYPNCEITWMTQAPANKLLENNPLIKNVFCLDTVGLLKLSNFQFDLGICIDKSLEATAIIHNAICDEIIGFTSDLNGKILPANPEAEELWSLGLSNYKKFYVNQKPETQLMAEAFQLNYQRDPYVYNLSKEERELVRVRREKWKQPGGKILLGLNTGCSNVISYKRPSEEVLFQFIEECQKFLDVQIVLLGGPEDHERNMNLSIQTGALYSPCNKGLRDGMCSVAACDLVFTGDSLGMHMAIAMRKYVIAWFGATCAHEIDLYDNGEKILSNMNCSPCWKRDCEKDVKCNEVIAIDKVLDAISKFRNQKWNQIAPLSL